MKKEELYIPGQDDFPGWDQFYAPRGSVRSRMRYSFKTLLLLPPLAGLLCFMYLTGYKNGNQDEIELKASLATEGQLRKSAEALAETRAATTAAGRREVERTNRQALVTMKALNSLSTRIKSDLDAAGDDENARRRLVTSTAEELQAIAVELDNGANDDSGLFERHLILGKIFLLLRESERGGSDEARRQFRMAHEAAKARVDAHPTDVQAQRDLLTSASLLAEPDFRSGQLPAARALYEEALEMARKLAQADRPSFDAKHDLSVAYSNLADVQLELGDLPAARDNYEAALDISQTLADFDPESADLKRDLCVALAKVGDAQLQLTGAVAVSHAAPAELERLQEQSLSDPRTARNRRDLYLFYSRIDDGNRRTAELKAARDAYRRSLDTARRLAGDNPPKLVAPPDHSFSQHSEPRAIPDVVAEVVQTPPRVEGDKPLSPSVQGDLAHAAARIAAAEMAAEDFSAAARDFGRAIAELTSLDDSDNGAGSSAYRSWLDDLRAKSQACRIATRSIEDLDFALRQPKADVPRLLGVRCRALARQGKYALAAVTADKLATMDPKRGDLLFAAAEGYALCAAGAAAARPTASAESDRFAARAFDLLRQSKRASIVDVTEFASLLLSDQNLAALVDRDDFKKLIGELDAEAAEQKRKNR